MRRRARHDQSDRSQELPRTAAAKDDQNAIKFILLVFLAAYAPLYFEYF